MMIIYTITLLGRSEFSELAHALIDRRTKLEGLIAACGPDDTIRQDYLEGKQRTVNLLIDHRLDSAKMVGNEDRDSDAVIDQEIADYLAAGEQGEGGDHV